ncbi:Uncharacterised protein [Vibrio cholerae]|uniref:Uncharacterized protein n=1 Tax=Vibrio cholerae TaxID=666 RepID=A0A655QP97_VIBCL|nr:Uncharacterised protein [Vibrio cholerae]CSA65143.1 Uncharacterised protein [Vibrio cholerae]CSB32170.1 Uncharacterised protein [Vibrio cholerae]CSB38558.1 Uncharacterised protein [Vibrio cholerae]CSC25093.1 Uncharacterised protein [Vibrio cholerae]
MSTHGFLGIHHLLQVQPPQELLLEQALPQVLVLVLLELVPRLALRQQLQTP